MELLFLESIEEAKNVGQVPIDIFKMIIGGLATWMTWITINQWRGEGKITTLQSSNTVINTKLDALIKQQEKLEEKIDMFISSEIDTLKQIAKDK